MNIKKIPFAADSQRFARWTFRAQRVRDDGREYVVSENALKNGGFEIGDRTPKRGEHVVYIHQN